jgi:hypothetical protein
VLTGSVPFLADFRPSRAILPLTIQQGETMTSFLDAEQEREDLLAMARIMHHQAWCAVNEEWINEPQQLESMLFVATNVLDRIEKLIDRLCGAPLAERVAGLKA